MRETRFPSSVFRHGDVPFLRALIAHFTFRILHFFETENFTYRVFYNNIEIHGHFSNSARSNRDSKLIEEARA